MGKMNKNDHSTRKQVDKLDGQYIGALSIWFAYISEKKDQAKLSTGLPRTRFFSISLPCSCFSSKYRLRTQSRNHRASALQCASQKPQSDTPNDPTCQRPHHHHHTFAQTWPETLHFCWGRVYSDDKFVTEFVSPTCTTPLAQVHVGGCCSFQEFQQVCQLLGAVESNFSWWFLQGSKKIYNRSM